MLLCKHLTVDLLETRHVRYALSRCLRRRIARTRPALPNSSGLAGSGPVAHASHGRRFTRCDLSRRSRPNGTLRRQAETAPAKREERKRARSSRPAEKLSATMAPIPGARQMRKADTTPLDRLELTKHHRRGLEHSVCWERVQPSQTRQDTLWLYLGDVVMDQGWIVTFGH